MKRGKFHCLGPSGRRPIGLEEPDGASTEKSAGNVDGRPVRPIRPDVKGKHTVSALAEGLTLRGRRFGLKSRGDEAAKLSRWLRGRFGLIVSGAANEPLVVIR